MRKIAVDLDGVVANFTDAYAAIVTKQTGITFPKADPDTFPMSWYWDREEGVTQEQELAAWDVILKSHDFWAKLKPLPQAQPAIHRLNYMACNGDEVVFITNRPGIKTKYQSERFLYMLGMNYPTVLVAADKLPLLKAMKIDFFIDDKPETILEVAADATVPHIYLKDWAYNRTQTYPFNVKRTSSLLAALEDAYGAYGGNT